MKDLYQSYFEFAIETMPHEDAHTYAMNAVREATKSTESYAKTYACLTEKDEQDLSDWVDNLRGAGL